MHSGGFKMVLPAGTDKGIPLILIFTISIVVHSFLIFYRWRRIYIFSMQAPHLRHFAGSMT